MKLTDIITENDGITICPGRLALIMGVVTFILLSMYNVIGLQNEFNAMEYGTGYGSLVGGGLTGIWLKSRTDKI